MITVHVKLFAVVKERAGASEMTLHLQDASTIFEARTAIAAVAPRTAEILQTSAFAVNRQYAAVNTTLHDGDELAVIPPVSGG